MIRLFAHLALILGLLLAPLGTGLEAATTKPLPRLTFGTSGPSGQAAITALGSDLPAVAERHGMTADQLRQLLLSNNNLRVSRFGRLLHVSPAGRDTPAPPPAAGQVTRTEAAPATSVSDPTPKMRWAGVTSDIPLDQTFQLHSQPGAPHTIYLDFRGRTFLRTESYLFHDKGFSSDIQVPPFSLDSNTAEFSTSEQRLIQEVWQRVAEVYSPFDIDVTTELPAQDRIARLDQHDPVYGIEVLITPRDPIWRTTSSVASYEYLFAFYEYGDNQMSKPSIVFHDGASTVAANLANAVSRSLGTTLGLQDKGTGTTEAGFAYYPGHGRSEVNGWAPIMGALTTAEGKTQPLRQFSMGEYPDATGRRISVTDSGSPEPQIGDADDDFDVLLYGVGPDDHLDPRADETIDDSPAHAAWLPVTRNTTTSRSSGAIAGVISSPVDVDKYYIKAVGGDLKVRVDAAAVGATADLKLRLLSATGTELAPPIKYAPDQNLSIPQQTFTIPAISSGSRTYILEVSGSGEGKADGTPAGSLTGYSQHGSMGAYSLWAEFPSPTATLPTAAISASPLTGDGPREVTLDASGSRAATGYSIVRYSWTFGDGTTVETDTATVKHIYQPSTRPNSSYEAKVIVTDDSGLTSQNSVNVIVTTPNTPTADFTVSPLHPTANTVVTFDATPSLRGGSDITGWTWTIHDGATVVTRTTKTTSYTFARKGTYNVELAVTNSYGTSHPVPKLVTVDNSAPTASFTPSAVTGPSAPKYAPMDYTLDTHLSADADGDPLTYTWKLQKLPSGEPVTIVPTATAPNNFRYSFSDAGNYKLILLTSDGTATSPPYPQTFRVNAQPTASFVPTPGTGMSVHFNASGSNDDVLSTLSYSWNFGDNRSAGPALNLASTDHPYNNPGIYHVTLTVTDEDGATATYSKDVTVGGPTAAFTFNQSQLTAPSNVTLNASSSSSGNGSAMQSYAWVIHDRGGNESRSGVTPAVYTFQKSGTFDVELTVTNSAGQTSTITKQVVVQNTRPTASFTASAVTGTNAPKAAPMDYTFDPSASRDDDGEIVNYRWTVTVPSGASSITIPEKTTGASFTQRFTTAGQYTVTLTTNDGLLDSTVASRTFTVNAQPTASFVPTPGTGMSVRFNASGSNDDVLSTLSYSWNFGDNTSVGPALNLASTDHPYNTPGTYHVTLTVTDHEGATATYSKDVTVGGPTAAFTTSPTPARGVAPFVVTFNAQNGGTGVRYAWAITDPSGAVDPQQPQSVQAPPAHTFTKRGTYNILLTVTNAVGSATATGQVIVDNSAPTASFTYTPVTGQVAAPMDYTLDARGSADANGDTLTYDWTVTVPAGASPVTVSPTSTPGVFRARFEKPGSYTVSLRTSDGALFSAAYPRTFTVNDAPKAGFAATPAGGLRVSFNAGESTDDQSVADLTYAWAFGDGETATGKTVDHEFASAKAYDVVLTVTDKLGAKGVKTTKVDLSPPNGKPTANFTISASSGTAPLSVSFDGTGSTDDKGIASYAWDFGDGSSDQTSNLGKPVHVFRTAGSFPVTLTVTDASGETSTAAQTVTVSAAQNQPRVSDIIVRLKSDSRGKSTARADVTVLDATGKPAKRAVVTAVWSGPYSLTKWGTTRSNGIASFRTAAVSAPGCFVLAVTSLKLAGSTYTLSPPATGQACR